MPRLRQQHPQNYVSSGNIHTEFENVVRYLNAAELGDKTVGELLSILFDERGVFDGPIQFRFDPTGGIECRVGQYTSELEGWRLLAPIDALRGTPGRNLGLIEGPLFYGRKDTVLSSGVDSVGVANPGYGYNEPPRVVFSAPDEPDGVLPEAEATINLGEVASITVLKPGAGYTSPPSVTLETVSGDSGVGATASATIMDPPSDGGTVAYDFDEAAGTALVYMNGLLLAEADYDLDMQDGVIRINETGALGDKVTIYAVRERQAAKFRRVDFNVAATQSVFPFTHTEDDRFLVFRNGVLQEAGATADYVSLPASDIIQFTDPAGVQAGEIVTVLTNENLALRDVAGLMLEEEYADANGLIRWDRISVADDEIPTTKVNGLALALDNKANLYVQSTTPASPQAGDLWLDTSGSTAKFKIYDGVQFLLTSPDLTLPTFTQSNAGQYIRVNGTGTALEYGAIDFSSLVPKTFMGAANGVASLDTDGKLPASQLPDIFSTFSIPFRSEWEDGSAAISAKTYYVSLLYKQVLRIDGLAFRLGTGTCTVQLAVDGAPVGPTVNVDTNLSSEDLSTVIEIVASDTPRRLGLIVDNVSTEAASLEVAIAAATVNI